MRYFFGFLVLLWTYSNSQWQQKNFVIGSYWEKNFNPTTLSADNNFLSKLKSANFNTISALNEDYDSRSYSLAGNNNANNQYIIQIAANNGLQTNIHDFRLISANIPPSVGTDYMSLPCVGATCLSLPAGRSTLLSYQYFDEPCPGLLTNVVLPNVQQLKVIDPKLPSFIILGASWIASHPYVAGACTDYNPPACPSTWLDYTNYVDSYFRDPSTLISSFDYYPFDLNSINTNGFWAICGADEPTPTYFKHLKLYADRTNTAKVSGKNMVFWGFGATTEHNSAGAHHPTPSLEMLHWQLNSNLIYGAKGIWWYTYDLPPYPGNINSPTTDPILFNNLALVNAEAAMMGSTLMKLNWVTTIHGSATDPNSKEINLSTASTFTPAISSPPLSKSSTCTNGCVGWKPDSLAIGIFTAGSDYYLLLMNKSVSILPGKVSYTNQTQYSVKGNVYPRLLNKTTGSWDLLSRFVDTGNLNTKFNLNLNPGDMQIVWLDKSSWLIPIRNLLVQ